MLGSDIRVRIIIQRVKKASVTVAGEVVGKISQGLMILLGVKQDDGMEEAHFLAKKVANLRIFEDDQGKMNLSVLDVLGDVLVVPNFTLYANANKGNRPSYIEAAQPFDADNLFKYFNGKLKNNGVKKVETGIFGASMEVTLVNDGPVTIILDTNEIMPRKQ